MNILINKNSETPIYQQIAHQIKTQILSGVLPAHQRLPSVRKLSKMCRVSIMTSQKAYETLLEEKLIYTLTSKGTYVNELTQQVKTERRLEDVEKLIDQAIQLAIQHDLSSLEIETLFKNKLKEAYHAKCN